MPLSAAGTSRVPPGSAPARGPPSVRVVADPGARPRAAPRRHSQDVRVVRGPLDRPADGAVRRLEVAVSGGLLSRPRSAPGIVGVGLDGARAVAAAPVRRARRPRASVVAARLPKAMDDGQADPGLREVRVDRDRLAGSPRRARSREASCGACARSRAGRARRRRGSRCWPRGRGRGRRGRWRPSSGRRARPPAPRRRRSGARAGRRPALPTAWPRPGARWRRRRGRR